MFFIFYEWFYVFYVEFVVFFIDFDYFIEYFFNWVIGAGKEYSSAVALAFAE